jgi:hypothetical protein
MSLVRTTTKSRQTMRLGIRQHRRLECDVTMRANIPFQQALGMAKLQGTISCPIGGLQRNIMPATFGELNIVIKFILNDRPHTTTRLRAHDIR